MTISTLKGAVLRDNFSKSVKENLAKRVNGRCSNPSCRKPTFGPRVELVGAVNIGVAAHISAAAPGGPRYESGEGGAYRASAENGIWLCQNCAKLVDNDESRYHSYLLKDWKALAESEALRNLEGGIHLSSASSGIVADHAIAGMSNQDSPSAAYLEFARLENIHAKWEEAEAIFDASKIMTDGAGKKLCWEVVELSRHNVTSIDDVFGKFLVGSPLKVTKFDLENHLISAVAFGGSSGENEELAQAIFEYCTSCNNMYGIRVLIGFMARNRYVDLVLTGC